MIMQSSELTILMEFFFLFGEMLLLNNLLVTTTSCLKVIKILGIIFKQLQNTGYRKKRIGSYKIKTKVKKIPLYSFSYNLTNIIT